MCDLCHTGSTGLTLDAAAAQTGNEVLLSDQVDGQHRDAADQGHGHEHVPLVRSLTLQQGNADGNGLQGVVSNQGAGEHEFIPGEDEGVQHGRNDAGDGNGNNHLPERMEIAGSVDSGGLIVGLGDRVEISHHHNDGVRQCEGDVGQDQAESGIVQLVCHHEQEEGNDQRYARDGLR